MSEIRRHQFDEALTRLSRIIDRPWDKKSTMDSAVPDEPYARSAVTASVPDGPYRHSAGSASGSHGPYARSAVSSSARDPDPPPGSISGHLPIYPTEDPDAPSPAPARRRVPLAAAIVAVVLGALTAGLIILPGSAPAAVEPPPAPVPLAAAAKVTLVVDVQGKVVTPGLRTLPEGARVADAIVASGGAVAGTDTSILNLARHLVDGEQIHVGVPPPAAAGGDPAKPPLTNLNTAPVYQLDALPGVGIVTAQRIVEYRTREGRFSTVDELRKVDGIGPARFEKLKDLVTVQ